MRKNYVDNIRWSVVVLVLIYHVIYNYNSSGVICNVQAQGIPQLDVLLPFVYPWFMALLFLVAGMSANYALRTHTKKEFVKARVVKLVLPSIFVMLLFSWSTGWVTAQYVDMFGGNKLPIIIRYLIYSMSGIGPLWFLHELFFASLILVLLLKIDRKGLLTKLGARVNVWTVFLLGLTVWLFSHFLNASLITVYRGVYIWLFLLGYFVFSREQLMEELKKFYLPLLILAVLTGIVYTYFNYGKNYAEPANMQSFFTNFYAWLGILAVLSCYKQWFDFSNEWTSYMSRKSFSIYVFHLPIMVLLVYALTEFAHFPVLLNYILTGLGTFVLVFLLDAVVTRIPLLRFLLLGRK